MPAFSMDFAFSSLLWRRGTCTFGARTAMGWGQKVRTPGMAPSLSASFRARRSTSSWPLWQPSKKPMASTNFLFVGSSSHE